mgnify:CR=1 FL=1
MSDNTTLAGVAIAIAFAAAMNNPLWQDVDGATGALIDQGLTPVHVGGYSWFGCDAKDRYKTEFTAVNVNGKEVSGVVCSGFFKGNTIRYD